MQLIQSIHQLSALGEEWNRLADRAGQVVLRHEWFLCAAHAFHAERQLAVVALWRNGRLSAIAPLARASIGGVDRLEFIGASALHEPSGFLYEDAGAHRQLVDALLDLKRPLVLQHVPVDTLRLVENGRVGGRRGFALTRRTSASLSIRLGAGSPGVVERLTGKLRYDLKRARTRATDEGGAVFVAVAPTPDDLDRHFDELVAVEGSGWKGRGHSSLAANDARLTFFKGYARLVAASGMLRLFFLRIGDTVAAAQMAVEAYGRLWVLKIGYDERLGHCSPGLLLTFEAIQYAHTRGLESYEFLGSAEPWEERWRPERREHGLLIFYPSTLKGCLGASFDMAGAAWRRLKPAVSSHEYHSS